MQKTMRIEELKKIILDKIDGFKSVQPKSSRFDDIRVELESYGYKDLKETIWNIINDFPEHLCKECGNTTNFKSFQDGYKKFCNSTCSNRFKGRDKDINQKISESVSKFNNSVTQDFWDSRTISLRRTLNNRSDEEKNRKKNEKSKCMAKVHSNRSDEEKLKYNAKISIAVKNSKLAQKQRIERAKLGAKALNEYRKSLKEEELKEFNKRFGPIDLIGDNRDKFREYYNLVWYFTNQNLSLLENIEKRSINFHLDHKYSIKQGFIDNIRPDIIGNNVNLEIIPAGINMSKGCKCSITKEELLELFNCVNS